MKELHSGPIQAHAVRLKPKDDLVSSILEAAMTAMSRTNSSSAFIMSAVGSVDKAVLRMANARRTEGSAVEEMKEWDEPLEIVGLVGTISPGGGKHLHISVSDAQGRAWGGHLVSGRVFTTLEMVLGTIQNVSFSREFDEATGYSELNVRPS